MVNLNPKEVEKAIIQTIENLKVALKLKEEITADMAPGLFIKSPVLVTSMGRIGQALGVEIPIKCYIFHNKQTKDQLTIKEAALKLIKEAKYGKK